MKDGITSTVKLTLDKDLISKTLDRQVRVVLTVARMGGRGDAGVAADHNNKFACRRTEIVIKQWRRSQI